MLIIMTTGEKRNLEDFLMQKVKESGYPLEIEISSLLDNEFVIFNTQYYYDEELKQGRDIDIYAIPNIRLEEYTMYDIEDQLRPFSLRTDLAVECKKSEKHAWVFYSRPHKFPGFTSLSGQYRDNFSQINNSSVMLLFFSYIHLHYDGFKDIAIAYDEIKKEGKEKSRREIFEAINQLVKYICYEIDRPSGRKVLDEKFLITLFFPVVVFDGDMYSVVIESNEPKLSKSNHVLMETHYRSPTTEQENSFLIDVVQRSYFPEFMKILRSDFLSIRNIIIQNHDVFLSQVKKIQKNYRKKMTK
jgi:hypothetical protein